MNLKKYSLGLVSLLVVGGFYPLIVNATTEIGKVESDVIADIVEGNPGEGTEEDITTKPQTGGYFLIKGVSDFEFSKVPLGTTRAASFLESDKNYSHGIEVVDLSGNGTGWEVQVKMKEFKISDGAHKGEELKGWELTIPTEKVMSKSSSLDKKHAPLGIEKTINGTNSAVVFYAEVGKGMGRYTNMFETYKGNADSKRTTGVRLKVPNTARKAKYNGILEWKLYDVPGTAIEY